MHIYLVGPQSHGQSVYACLTGPFISQLWNVLLCNHVKSLRLLVVFGSYRWLLVMLPVCRAFEPAERSYLIRTLRSWDPSRHDRDAECNLTPRFLVDFIVPRVLAPAFGPRTWS